MADLPEPNVPEGDWFVRDAYIKEYAQAYAAAKVAEERERHKRDVEKLRRALGDIAEYAHKTDDVRRWCAEALSEKGYE